MAQKVLVNLDLNGNQILGLRLEVLATDPTAGGLYEGRVWFNSVDNFVKYYDGATVIPISAAGVVTLTVDNVTIENIGTASNPSIRVKALGISNAQIAAGAAIALSKLAVDPLARANHTGTQLAATVSDFDTQVQLSRLDQMAAPTADVALNTRKISGLGDPTNPQDAATKNYVDAAAAGIDWKASVRAASVGNITLSGAQTIDGVVCLAGDRVLLKNQTAGAENGIWVVAAGAWARASDANTSLEVTSGMGTFVSEGTINGNTAWILTTDDPIVLATTALVFTQFSGPGEYTAGLGLLLTGTQFSLTIPVPVTSGGTGGITVAAAKTSLGFMTRMAFNSAAATSTTCTHNLNTLDVTVQVYEVSTGAQVIADVVLTSVNVVTVSFAVAQAASFYRIVIIG